MISGDKVRTDKGTVDSELTSFSSQIQGMSGSWEGESYKKVDSEAAAFVSECAKIGTGMEAFASACDDYVLYKKNKEHIEKMKSDLAAAQSYDGETNSDELKDSIQNLEDTNENLAKQITANLSTASSTHIEGSSSSSITIGAATFTGGMGGAGKFVSSTLDGSSARFLSFDENEIFNKIGTQGAAQCGVYSVAYGRVILDGKSKFNGKASHQDVANAYNNGSFAWTKWVGMTSSSYGSSKARMNAIWDEVNGKGKPCVVATGSKTASNHYVLVVGFRDGATKENLKASDLVVLDPAREGKNILHYYDSGAFNNSGYGLQMVTYNT